MHLLRAQACSRRPNNKPKMHFLDHTGNEIDTNTFANDLKQIHFPNGKLRGIAAASDMDNTMFDNDLGTLVFLEKLSETDFWDFDMDEFGQILLPKKYRELLQKGADKQIDDLKPALCRLALDLGKDIINLYSAIRAKIRRHPGPNGEQMLVEEFARKMIELDRIFMMIDSILSKYLNGEILMRTRFFSGKHPSEIARLTRKVMKRERTNIGRRVPLLIHPENAGVANQKINENHIREVHGMVSPYESIDRVIKTIAITRDIIKTAIQELRIPTVVATGNLKAIAKTAISESDYSFMEKQTYVRQKESSLVVGTWLRSAENGTLHPKIQGKPVLGMRKAREALQFATGIRKDLKLALGDSPSTDGPMIANALALNGVAVLVGQNIDSIRKRFEKVVPPETRYKEKIYYVVEDK